jgi:hypothetical protein
LNITTANFINTSNWYQIVATYISGSRRIYLNGILIASDGPTFTISTSSGGMSVGVFGGYAGIRSYYYNGKIAIVNVYNRNLISTEVLQNYNALKGRFNL